MLSNAYFLAKFRFDTAENEPAKNLQNFRKCIFEKCIFSAETKQKTAERGAVRVDRHALHERRALGPAAEEDPRVVT